MPFHLKSRSLYSGWAIWSSVCSSILFLAHPTHPHQSPCCSWLCQFRAHLRVSVFAMFSALNFLALGICLFSYLPSGLAGRLSLVTQCLSKLLPLPHSFPCIPCSFPPLYFFSPCINYYLICYTFHLFDCFLSSPWDVRVGHWFLPCLQSCLSYYGHSVINSLVNARLNN